MAGACYKYGDDRWVFMEKQESQATTPWEEEMASSREINESKKGQKKAQLRQATSGALALSIRGLFFEHWRFRLNMEYCLEEG